jgi:CBS-domain-containing membrane protein
MAIFLLTIYTKSEQVDIAADDLRSIIAEYDQRATERKEEVLITTGNC